VEKEESQWRAGKPVDLDYEVRVDVGKVQSPWCEDVDLEPLEADLVAVGAPVQDLPPIVGVPRPDGEETVVILAKPSLDGLRAARKRRETKDVEVLIRVTGRYVDVCAFLGNDSPLACDPYRVCRVYTPSLR